MKRKTLVLLLIVAALCGGVAVAFAQSRNTPTFYGGYRARSFTHFGPGAPPATCSSGAGDMFIRTDAPVAVYFCQSDDTWQRMTPAKFTAALTPAAVDADTCAEQTFTVTGVATGDVVTVNKPTTQAGLAIGGVRASATNQVAINFCNVTGAPITPTAGETYSFLSNK